MYLSASAAHWSWRTPRWHVTTTYSAQKQYPISLGWGTVLGSLIIASVSWCLQCRINLCTWLRMTCNPHVPKHRNRLKDPPDRTGKLRFIVQSVPITLLCCRAKQRNRMFACSSTKVGSTSKETVSVWCALPEPLPCESPAWKCLDTDRIMEPTLYLITEMLLHNSKLALISMGLQAGGSGRVHFERSSLLLERKQSITSSASVSLGMKHRKWMQ